MAQLPLDNWVGRTEQQSELIALPTARRMLALLDRPLDSLRDGDPLPPGWHWLFCNTVRPRSEWAEDGHVRRGTFLPPVPHPRRMWAGGTLKFLQPLRIGEPAERRSEIVAIEEKQGSTGALVIVRIAHRYWGPAGLAIDEEQHLVYRGTSASSARAVALSFEPDWRETFVPDEVSLFFFSALTMNGHRIHYDQPYATGTEGHPGLLVHAPLTALLLLDAATRRSSVTPHAFTYRALRPLYCGAPITLAGYEGDVCALDPDGHVAMQGRVAGAHGT